VSPALQATRRWWLCALPPPGSNRIPPPTPPLWPPLSSMRQAEAAQLSTKRAQELLGDLTPARPQVGDERRRENHWAAQPQHVGERAAWCVPARGVARTATPRQRGAHRGEAPLRWRESRGRRRVDTSVGQGRRRADPSAPTIPLYLPCCRSSLEGIPLFSR
jgi:hypothetical protein